MDEVENEGHFRLAAAPHQSLRASFPKGKLFFYLPLGDDSPCQGEMSRSDRRGRDRCPEGG